MDGDSLQGNSISQNNPYAYDPNKKQKSSPKVLWIVGAFLLVILILVIVGVIIVVNNLGEDNSASDNVDEIIINGSLNFPDENAGGAEVETIINDSSNSQNNVVNNSVNNSSEIVGLVYESQFENCVSRNDDGLLMSVCSNKTSYGLQETTDFEIEVLAEETTRLVFFLEKSNALEDVTLYQFEVLDATSEGKSPLDAKYGDKMDMSRLAFTITGGGYSGLSTSFSKEGEYDYRVLLYRCSELLDYDLSCSEDDIEDLSGSSSKSLFFWDEYDYIDFFNRLSPVIDLTLDVFVEGGELACEVNSDCTESCDFCTNNSQVCSSTFTCVNCTSGEDCIEGYTCKLGQCTPDPLYCTDVSDCADCPGCAEGAVECRNNRCSYCSSFSSNVRSCLDGFVCENWGCVDRNLLQNLKTCDDGCDNSGYEVSPELGCPFSSDPDKNQKCIECSSDASCILGARCLDYICTPY